MSRLCGLCPRPSKKTLRTKQLLLLGSADERDGPNALHTERSTLDSTSPRENRVHFAWAREDQLSVIFEVDSTRNTPIWEKTEAACFNLEKTFRKPGPYRTRFIDENPSTESIEGQDLYREEIQREVIWEEKRDTMAESHPPTPRPIQPPPRDVRPPPSVGRGSRIDKTKTARIHLTNR